MLLTIQCVLGRKLNLYVDYSSKIGYFPSS